MICSKEGHEYEAKVKEVLTENVWANAPSMKNVNYLLDRGMSISIS
jgi:hypothetical protein